MRKFTDILEDRGDTDLAKLGMTPGISSVPKLPEGKPKSLWQRYKEWKKVNKAERKYRRKKYPYDEN